MFALNSGALRYTSVSDGHFCDPSGTATFYRTLTIRFLRFTSVPSGTVFCPSGTLNGILKHEPDKMPVKHEEYRWKCSQERLIKSLMSELSPM